MVEARRLAVWMVMCKLASVVAQSRRIIAMAAIVAVVVVVAVVAVVASWGVSCERA